MVADDNSKETIKARMLRYALNYWNLKNLEDLDPAVKLMLEALSLELYNLGNETKDARARVLEKIAGLLAPDFLTAPAPAHAVLHAAPVEPVEVLPATAAFLAQARAAARQSDAADATPEISFTPVDAVRLFDVQIAHLAAGGNLFSYDAAYNRLLTTRAGRARPAENNAFWMGLRVHNKIENVEGLAFYFDWKNTDPVLSGRTYQLLPLARWFLGEEELQTSPGILYVSPDETPDAYQNIFLEYDTLYLLEKDVKQYYEPKFVSLGHRRTGNLHAHKRPYPETFKGLFAENDLQGMKEPLLWLKIVFPATVQPDFLTDLHVYPNAFPVLNRQLNDLKYRLKGGSTIIPLRTAPLQQFLSVRSLTDETRDYKAVPYRKTEGGETGTYTVRKGGVERFDERNARELIGYLLEMLRNESAAFAAYGYDFIAGTLKEMNQKISLMEQKTKGYLSSGAEVPNYIFVKPYEGQDMMYAEYWTTLAGAANGLRAGTKLQQGRGVRVKQDDILLLTATAGGTARLRPEERLNAFRYGLMTRNRIITKEDIRAFCFYELGNRIQKVSIERGFEVSAAAKEAFRRTVNVVLTPAETETLTHQEWRVLCEQLQAKLQTRSGMSNDYRIVLDKSR